MGNESSSVAIDYIQQEDVLNETKSFEVKQKVTPQLNPQLNDINKNDKRDTRDTVSNVSAETISTKIDQRTKHDPEQSPDMLTEVEESTDVIDPMEVLFQFIPYYGQGDPSNDSLVKICLLCDHFLCMRISYRHFVSFSPICFSYFILNTTARFDLHYLACLYQILMLEMNSGIHYYYSPANICAKILSE